MQSRSPSTAGFSLLWWHKKSSFHANSLCLLALLLWSFVQELNCRVLLHHSQSLTQTLGTPRGLAEAVPGRGNGRDIWEPGHIPQIRTLPCLTAGGATSLVILCCKSKGNGFSVPFWAGEQWRASFGNTVMGSLFQRIEFLLGCCETLGSQKQEHKSV